MSREEEERRLALSTAIAQINAAQDLLSTIALATLPPSTREHFDRGRGHLWRALHGVERELGALKQKAIDETPEEDR